MMWGLLPFSAHLARNQISSNFPYYPVTGSLAVFFKILITKKKKKNQELKGKGPWDLYGRLLWHGNNPQHQ